MTPGYARVPLVCQSCIYDLGFGSAGVRPDAAMGYEACEDAKANHPRSGNTGADAEQPSVNCVAWSVHLSQGLAFMRYDLADWRWQQ